MTTSSAVIAATINGTDNNQQISTSPRSFARLELFFCTRSEDALGINSTSTLAKFNIEYATRPASSFVKVIQNYLDHRVSTIGNFSSSFPLKNAVLLMAFGFENSE